MTKYNEEELKKASDEILNDLKEIINNFTNIYTFKFLANKTFKNLNEKEEAENELNYEIYHSLVYDIKKNLL